MYSWNEYFRELANWLELPANIVFIDIPRECGPIHYDMARSKLPSAYFISSGECKESTHVFSTVQMLVDAVNEATKYALEDAYIVFTFADTRSMAPETHKNIRDLILALREIKFKPVIINFYPIDFMNHTSLYYDNVVLLSHKNKRDAYNEIIATINTELLQDEAHEQNMFEVNARLGNGPLVPSKSLIFSKPSTQVVDFVAFGLLFYGLYKMVNQCKKRYKFKMS